MTEEPALLTIADLLFNGNQDPDHPAIESPGCEPMTFRDLREQIRAVVKTLNAQGYRPDDRIAVVMPEGPAAAVMIIAAMAGFTTIPLDARIPARNSGSSFPISGLRRLSYRRTLHPARQAAVRRNIRVIGLVPSTKKAGMFRLEPASSHETGDVVSPALRILPPLL